MKPSDSPSPDGTPARPITMAQLAKYVGVSPSAVSVVLSNTNSRIKVSDATRQRILEAARELNYQPNVVARSLRKQRTNMIGFYKLHGEMIDPEYAFLGAILHGVLAGCRDSAKNLLLYGQADTVGIDEMSMEVLNGQLEGLVLYAWGSDDFTRRLAESHLPVVTVADEIPGLPCVAVDDELGGRLMVRYLVEKGYRSALYWLPSFSSASSTTRRYTSYMEEASKCGLQVETFQEHEKFEVSFQKIMTRIPPPEVISVHCDEAAYRVIGLLSSMGFQVPHDVAVTGFDGTPVLHPQLTTIRAPWKQVAHTAVSLLIQRRAGETIPMQTILPVELAVGETA